ncbi:putative glycolipid-binding domain-containing protein [Paenibacillus albicereus]|uniref:Putative glycolipid-binding domain-containing protein n=1 Tax=Paenibacillus albicereus TaxID=2726185 RepID=A0A6H2GUA3_9BACL|nr:putative glycolipid-binding domain-containing protein [Paenibacillus albicereus]QJC50990.1 putative glycolipid-binding domain-containing protein [Paenibacillus albicereus]
MRNNSNLDLVEERVWRRRDLPCLEHFRLSRTDSGFRLDGTVAGIIDGRALSATYSVRCDESWHTREVEVLLESGGEPRRLKLSVDKEQRWRSGGRELPELAGIVDVDFELTPATNTLPIRRLRLEPGQAATVRAAWIRLPLLEVQPLEQSYERIGVSSYRYRSSSFATDLETDPHGVVIRYGDLWAEAGEAGA